MRTSSDARRAKSGRIAMAALVGACCILLTGGFSASCSTAHVTSAQLARGYSQGKAIAPTASFDPTDHVLHLVVVVANAPDDTKVGAVWYAVDAGSTKNEKLDSASGTLKNGQDHVDLTLSNTADWPSGNYKVDLMLDQKRERTLDFQVR